MTHNNNKPIEEFHTQVIHEFSKTLEMFTLTPAEARLFVTLYLNGEPMTLDEMSDALGKSKTSMSTGIRSLVDLNLVERVWKKGIRKDLYQADENLYRKFMSTYIQKWLEATERQEQSLNQIKEELEKNSPEYKNEKEMTEANVMCRRVEDMIEFHNYINRTFQDMLPDGTTAT